MSTEGAEHHEKNRPSKDHVKAKRCDAEDESAEAIDPDPSTEKVTAGKAEGKTAAAAFTACKMRPYSEHSETVAVAAVAAWLNHFADDESGAYTKVVDEKNNTMLMVASENGYPKVVRKLLEDDNFVKFELDARAEETRQNPGDFTSARKLAKHARQGQLFSSVSGKYEDMQTNAQEPAKEWEGVNGRKARCKSCYDMITLYMYIGEEIADVPTLISVIAALHELGLETMDDIQDNWGDFRGGIREDLRTLKVGSALVTRLSKVLVNYSDNWAKPFNELEAAKHMHKNKSQGFFSGVFFSIIVSLIVFVPVTVLAIYDVLPWEEQLWSECFVWLCMWFLAQIIFMILTGPIIGWGMIKESSQDKDL
eukprot:scaffold27511_cov60-Phaeocystis_antarctica.AAC.1